MKASYHRTDRHLWRSTAAVAIVVAVLTMAVTRAGHANLYVTAGLAGPFAPSPTAIYRFTPTGSESTIGSLSSPYGLALDANGDLFATDVNSGSIYEFSTSGIQSTFATGLSGPHSLVFDKSGALYEAGDASFNVYKYTPSGVRSVFAYWYGSAFQIAVNSNRDVFQADANNYVVEKFTQSGLESGFAGVPFPAGVAVDKFGNVFVSSDGMGGIGPGFIYKFTPSGSQSVFASGLDGPHGLAFDSNGNLFEADSFSGNIYEFAPNGIRTTFATGLTFPTYLAVDDRVPEPSSLFLMVIGALAVGQTAFRRRSRILNWKNRAARA